MAFEADYHAVWVDGGYGLQYLCRFSASFIHIQGAGNAKA
jgi:hypothetical protein